MGYLKWSTLGYDLKIACAKFQGNRSKIDGEIDEKHALQNYQNECGPGYKLLLFALVGHMTLTLELMDTILINCILFKIILSCSVGFHSLEVVGRGSDTQLQVGENVRFPCNNKDAYTPGDVFDIPYNTERTVD